MDYYALETRMRAEVPAERYGTLGYLLSRDYPVVFNGKGVPFFEGEQSLQIGYDCRFGNLHLFNTLVELGRRPSFRRGKDALGVMKNHCFCQDEEGTVLDVVPLYPFVGAEHTVVPYRRPLSIGPTFRINPITIINEDGTPVMLYFNLRPVNDRSRLILSLTARSVKTKAKFQLSVDVDLEEYMRMYGSDSFEEVAAERDVVIARLFAECVVKRFKPEPSDDSSDDDIKMLGKQVLTKQGVIAPLIHKIAYSPDWL